MDFQAEKQLLMRSSRNVQLKLSNDTERKLNAIAVHVEKTINDIKKAPSEFTNCVKNLEEKVTSNTNELLKCESDLDNIKTKQKDLLMQLDVSQRCREDKEAELKSLTETVNALEQKVLEKQKMTSDELARYRQHVDFSSSTLGLRIRRVASNTKYHNLFQFTNIDKREPEKTFSISIKMKDDGTYAVTDCEPLIHDLARLIARLNETKHWHSFLVVVRQRFVDSVSQL